MRIAQIVGGLALKMMPEMLRKLRHLVRDYRSKWRPVGNVNLPILPQNFEAVTATPLRSKNGTIRYPIAARSWPNLGNLALKRRPKNVSGIGPFYIARSARNDGSPEMAAPPGFCRIVEQIAANPSISKNCPILQIIAAQN